MLSFYKKQAYYFNYIRKNNRIRFIRNKYSGSKRYHLFRSKDLNNKNTAFNLKQCFNNRRSLSFDEKTGYFRYKKMI